MPMDGTSYDIEADFEILEAIGAHVEDIVENARAPKRDPENPASVADRTC